MIESVCTRCIATFNPAGTDPEDFIHGVREDGTECGGIGVIVGEWQAPPNLAPLMTGEFEGFKNLLPIEMHGLENPHCKDSFCQYHHPERVVTVERAKEILLGVGWSTRDLDRWNDDELIHFAREEKS